MNEIKQLQSSAVETPFLVIGTQFDRLSQAQPTDHATLRPIKKVIGVKLKIYIFQQSQD